MCQVKTRRACQNNGGTDMGPGTCNPNPCGGVPPCGTFLLKWGIKSGTGNGQFLGPLGVSAGQAVAVGLIVYALTLAVSLLGAPAFAVGSRSRAVSV